MFNRGFISDTKELSPSRELDVSTEEQIETYRNLEAHQMAPKTLAFLKEAGRWGEEGSIYGCMECNLVLNLTKSYIGHGDNQAFIL